MRFRPCIDIHEGKVKQIVGASLRDAVSDGENGRGATENFVSEKDAAWYASFYREKDLGGGHVIMLDHAGSPTYGETKAQAIGALLAWPGGMMAGGGITPENASEFIDAGAERVIVTSYVFRGGRIDMERLAVMEETVGRDRLVLDLSCRRVSAGTEANGSGRAGYIVATDRWQKLTDEEVTPELMERLAEHCAEFLVHAVDVEGKRAGIDETLVRLLAKGAKIPVTYAGGIGSVRDIETIGDLGEGRIDFTVGSALDIFGGELTLEEVLSAAGR